MHRCHRFDPPLLVDAPLSAGWHHASLRTTAAAGRYSKIDGGPGKWSYTPIALSFEITFAANGGMPLRVSFDNISIACDVKFAWPSIGDPSSVVAHLARDKIGGHDACALTEIRHLEGCVGRVNEPGTGVAHD